jgi:hypothetical protein
VRVGPGEVVGSDLDRPGLVDAFEGHAALGRVNLRNPPALAVEDFGAWVVDAGDDEIAGGKARLAHFDLLRSELPGLAADLARNLVQAPHLGVLLGDHHRVLAALVRLMPVADHRLASLLRVWRDRDSLLGLVEDKRLVALALPDPLRRLAVEVVAVSDHLVKVDRLATLREGAEQPARLDLAKLLGVADQDELRLRSLGVGRVAPGWAESTIPASSIKSTDSCGKPSPPSYSARSSAKSRLAMLEAGKPSARITFAARQVGAAARNSIPACAQPSAAATIAKVLPLPASPITTATPSGLVSRRRIISRWSAFKVGRAPITRAAISSPAGSGPFARIRSAAASASRSSSQIRRVV